VDVKRISKSILFFLLPGLLLCGCANQTDVASKKMLRLAYGQSFHDVTTTLGKAGVRSFIIRQTNTVFECRIVHIEHTEKLYSLLFQDGVFCSALDAERQKNWSAWKGFDNASPIDFTRLNFFVADFFPPRPLADLNFANSPKTNSASSGIDYEGLGMVLVLGPLFLPVAPIALPFMVISEENDSHWSKAIAGFKTGETEPYVEAHLGKPSKKFTSGNRSVWIYGNRMASLGFEEGKLAWVLYGMDASAYTSH
jgi:hypothetical protein